MRYFLLILLALFTCCLHADDEERHEIEQRIKPFGAVHIEGTDKTTSKEAQPAPEKKALSGQEIYEKYCFVCHKDGIANAPKFQNEEDWKPRLAQAGSIDGLVSVAIKGLNAMPPKGTCQDCTEKDMKEAIQYMLPHHE